MNYSKYKTEITPLCPVAIRLGQTEVHASGHSHWGVVTCEGCEAQFVIGPNRIYGSRRTDVDCAKELGAILAEDHRQNRNHQNGYELPD